MTTMTVKQADGTAVAVEKPLPPGRAGQALSRPVVLSTEDSTALAAVASEATQANVLAALQAAPPITVGTAHIALNGNLSDAVDCTLGRPARIDMPPTWDAAAITFQVSEDNTNFFNFYKADGTEYSVTVAAGRAVLLTQTDFRNVRYLKLRSGPSGVPVPQTGARAINVVLVG